MRDKLVENQTTLTKINSTNNFVNKFPSNSRSINKKTIICLKIEL